MRKKKPRDWVSDVVPYAMSLFPESSLQFYEVVYLLYAGLNCIVKKSMKGRVPSIKVDG